MNQQEIADLSADIIMRYYENDVTPFLSSMDEDALWYGPAEGQFIRGRAKMFPGDTNHWYSRIEEEEETEEARPASPAVRLTPKKAEPKPSLPVCGILTTPYPCLVLRSGARIHEGASFGDSVVLKIEADAVTVTNATGKFVWKP